MSETAADEQDLAKALDNVANAVSGFDDKGASNTSSSLNTIGNNLPPITPLSSPGSTPTLTPPSVASTDDASDGDASSSTQTPVSPLVQPLYSNSQTTTQDEDAPADSSAEVPATPDETDTPPADNSNDLLGLSDQTVTNDEPAPGNDSSNPLADIKSDALNELRPLVNKLNVAPQEKFDTYLLLIRSTDDSSLIAPAHEAAKAIEDEAKRAEALLDIIKEIDYLSRQDKPNN